MTAPAWMPLYVADYLADTGHLSTLEHGAYMLLIMHYWQNGGLPIEDMKLARICRLSLKEWQNIRDTLSDLFSDDWTHKRVDAELTESTDIIGKKSAAGRAGGLASAAKRRQQKQTTVEADANDRSTSATANVNTSPTPKQTPTSPLRSEVNSEPNGSGAKPPLSTSQFIFAKGRELLAKAENPPKDPGALVRKWLRDSGEDELMAALRACEAKQTPDPVAYITATLRKRGPPGMARAEDDIYRGVL